MLIIVLGKGENKAGRSTIIELGSGNDEKKPR
jgi:hypothetical protein